MALYNYTNGGYINDDQSKAGFICSDHVCRPVIIDDEGRKRPIISYNPNHHNSESYVTTGAERIGEHVHVPNVVTDYKYIPQANVKPLKGCSFTNDKETYYGIANDKWCTPSSPEQEHPPQVEEFITNVQTEVSRPTRPLLQTTNWRNIPNSTGHVGGNGDTISDENRNNKGYYFQRNDSFTEPIKGHVTGTPIYAPTDDIERVVETLKEAAKSSLAAPQPTFTAPTSTSPKRDSTDYAATIDSREAARRYGSFNKSSKPFQTGENYTGTISSREAAQKYKGTSP